GCQWEQSVLQSWPGPVTWVLPLKSGTQKRMPDWITGGRDTVAVRVSDHPVVQQLCLAFDGPIVSTSANISNQPPAKSCQEVAEIFNKSVFCVAASLGTLNKPTEIRDARTGRVLR
ncbi:MAG: Sua5/YciO/YrdC/YwlC family protein, partial [Thiomicrorhabdus sp.]|nr:Sua5/YciO/YrdC/YwlC family protein [Thiomicrorhabdus sp.]